MNSLKYIPGDFVKLNNEVVTIAETNLFCYSVVDSGGDFYTNAVYKNIKPISLTPQILEKNGWEWDGNDFTLGALVLYPEADYFIFDGFNVKLRYVHTLQHLLFGLGLDSDMII